MKTIMLSTPQKFRNSLEEMITCFDGIKKFLTENQVEQIISNSLYDETLKSQISSLYSKLEFVKEWLFINFRLQVTLYSNHLTCKMGPPKAQELLANHEFNLFYRGFISDLRKVIDSVGKFKEFIDSCVDKSSQSQAYESPVLS